jgi:hypothetical protein
MKRFVFTAVAVVAACSVATAQRQPGGGTRGATSLLPQVVSNKDLQSELKVTDEQTGKFKDVAAKQADATKKLRELFTGGERPDRAKMTEITGEMTKVNEEITKVVTDTLTTEQKKRVKQIEVQRMGLRAFANADVLKALKLTDEQKAKVKTIGDEAGTGRRPGGRPQPGAERPDAAALAEAAKKRAEATAKAMAKVAAELTDDQKKAWKELTGEKFDLTKLNLLGGRAPMRNDQ